MAGTNGNLLTYYEADSGDIHVMRVSEKTLTLQVNAGIDQPTPTGPPTSEFWFKVSRGNTEYGGKPRMVGICFTGTPPGDLEAGPTYWITVFQPNTYNLTTIRSIVSYQGAAAIVVGKRAESIYPGI